MPSKQAVSILIASIILSGCSHQVLTFFFTGVPDPNAANTVESPEPGLEALADSEELINQRLIIPLQSDFTHGPWANRQCSLCHGNNEGKRFNQISAGNSARGLAASPSALCRTCHSGAQFSESNTQYWQHGPSANGLCTNCHSPHKSKRPFMLLGDDNRALCATCHGDHTLHSRIKESINNTDDCVACHNPHAATRQLLLKAGDW